MSLLGAFNIQECQVQKSHHLTGPTLASPTPHFLVMLRAIGTGTGGAARVPLRASIWQPHVAVSLRVGVSVNDLRPISLFLVE